MNTKNNKRRQTTRETIEKLFIERLQTKEIGQITVAELCKAAHINRSTFYANYLDIYDLADALRDKLEQEVSALYGESRIGMDYRKLFEHVRDNQLFYKTYFKLGYDDKHAVDLSALSQYTLPFPEDQLEYHVAFHKAGLNAVLQKWLASGCVQSPETMVNIIEDEYRHQKQ